MAAAARKAPDPLRLLDPELEGYDGYFIEAINDCLSIFPKDRLPSAAAWRDIVDLDRRRQILVAAAENDRDLEEKVCELVAEQRKALARDKADERIRAAEEAAARIKAEEEAKAKAAIADRERLAEEAAERAAEAAAMAEAEAARAAAAAAKRAERAAALAEAGIITEVAPDSDKKTAEEDHPAVAAEA